VASTPEEARAALERMPEPRVVAPFVSVMGGGWSAVMGGCTGWRGGRGGEAFSGGGGERLRDAAVSVRNTLASYQLGEVLSALGDKAGRAGRTRCGGSVGVGEGVGDGEGGGGEVKALGCGK
jgi:hypothetical protein